MADAASPQAASGNHPHSVAVVSYKEAWESAAAEVRSTLRTHADDPPDLLVVFASSRFAPWYDELVQWLHHTIRPGRLIGASARGLIGEDDAQENCAGISAIAFWLPGAVFKGLRLTSELCSWEGGRPPAEEENHGMLMFVEPWRWDAQQGLRTIRGAWKGLPIVGAQASTHAAERRAWVFLDDRVYDSGGVALAIGGPFGLEVAIAQGASPIGEAWTVTAAEGSRILTISNRPAVDVLEEASATVDNEFDLLLGIPMSEYQDHFVCGDFVIRAITEIDRENGSLRVGSLVRTGQTVQFHQRDSDDASVRMYHEVWDAHRRLEANPPIGTILCTCRGRGSVFFGVEDHDAALVKSVFPDVPLAGVFSAGEIGPVCGVPALNGFAAVLGMIVRRG